MEIHVEEMNPIRAQSAVPRFMSGAKPEKVSTLGSTKQLSDRSSTSLPYYETTRFQSPSPIKSHHRVE